MANESQKNSFSASSPNEKTTTYNIDDLTQESQQADARASQQADARASQDDDEVRDYSQTQSSTHNQVSAQDSAIDLLRGSVIGVLDSVIREYEPQIAQFTATMAHQAVERGVEFASTTASRAQKQSWLRIGVAAALGVGIIAVLSYESADTSADSATPRRRATH